MENEILTVLYDIKVAIYILITVVVGGVIANWVRVGVSLKNHIKRELDDAFSDAAAELYDKGEYEKLLTSCEECLKRKPNHSYALWYKAKVYYQQQNYKKAKQYFELLSSSEPTWDESHVQPYLKKIEAMANENCYQANQP